MGAISRMQECIERIYGPDAAPGIMRWLEEMLRRYRAELPPSVPRTLGEGDAMLITYPDQIREVGKPPIESLAEFSAQFLTGLVSSIHLLPFYPSSSDDGFSVTDYRAVDPTLGEWSDVQYLAADFHLMFDAVVNHASAQGAWFRGFLQGQAPYRGYFVCVDGAPDLSAVVRPRTLPLLTRFPSARGDLSVWTTFSPDQVDLDYRNPLVLLEMLDILLFYVKQGATFIRLDAIAYLWKEVGTTCIHRPQVHHIVRLIRAVMETVAPHVRLLTETNVAHAENVSYFGDGTNEAHLVYNFSLPPLMLHAFHSGTAATLSEWAAGLDTPSEDAAFFNVLATHDGIGLNGARGIIADSEIEELVQRAAAFGNRISFRSNSDGTSASYEINANFYDALESVSPGDASGLGVQRFLTAHAILLGLRGMPGIYFHSMFGSRGWEEGAARSGQARMANRQKLERVRVVSELADPESLRYQIYHGMRRLLAARRTFPSFAPGAEQRVVGAGPGILAMVRSSELQGEQILCLHNLTMHGQSVPASVLRVAGIAGGQVRDLIGGGLFNGGQPEDLMLRPYQSMWLRMGG